MRGLRADVIRAWALLLLCLPAILCLYVASALFEWLLKGDGGGGL